MGAIIQKLLKYLAYAAAAGVMLLALLVGIARLLLPLVPEYHEDIRAWAAQATGLEVQFQHISASWPISGPAIRFLDVTIKSPEDHRMVFVADRLDIGISLVGLLRDRVATIARVGVENTRVEVQRRLDGSFLIQGRPLSDFLPGRDPDEPLPQLRIDLTGVEVEYRDAARGDDAQKFHIEQADVRLDAAGLYFEGDILLPAHFGERAVVSMDLPASMLQGDFDDDGQGAEEWSAYVTGEMLDVARILQYSLDMPTPVASMDGNLVFSASFAGPRLTSVTAELDITDIELRQTPDLVDSYESIEGRIEWARQGDGWLLSGSNLDLRRNAQDSPRSDFTVAWQPGPGMGEQRWRANAGFVRLHDWFPVVRAIVSKEVRDEMLPTSVGGDISEFAADVRLLPDVDAEFEVELQFEDVGVAGLPGGEALVGMSGTVVADNGGGRLELDSDDVSFFMPQLFATALDIVSVEGLFVWRVTVDGLRVLSDNITIKLPVADVSSRLSLDFPSNGDSVYMDLSAHGHASNGAGLVEYLPARRLPKKITDWLERSIVRGRITGADINVRGPMREFPFDHGEGVFKIVVDIEDGVLDLAPGWPRLENLEGRAIFDGVQLYSSQNRGNFGSLPVLNADAYIKDLRAGMLEVTGPQAATFDQALTFLRASPISKAVGPILERVEGGGEFSADVDLRIPVMHPHEYKLQLDVTTEDAQLDLQRLDFGLTKIAGSLTVRNMTFYADEMTAELLGEPVSIRMRPAEPGGLYSQFVTLSGTTPVSSWIDVFKLPQADKFSGAADWQAMALFPVRRENDTTSPLHIMVRSDLNGVESRLPAPASKSADTIRALTLDVAFPTENELEVTGRFGADLAWALQFETVDEQWKFDRGAVHAGSARALLPLEPGIELSGHIDFLQFDKWRALADGQADSSWQDLYNSVALQIDRLSLLGQFFPDVSIDAFREDRKWKIAVDGPNLSGVGTLPMQPDNDNPAQFEVQRLWLLDPDPSMSAESDPRAVIPLSISVADFILGDMHFGSLQADLQSTPSGILIEPISMQGETFSIVGDVAWLVHPNDDTVRQSRMRLSLTGTDIKAILASLGYDPVLEGETVAATADLTWTGAPDSDFLRRADGSFSIDMKKGAVLSLEPGGGRLLGVLSITALPRRLALDFRDVTDEGLGFDTLRGDFTVDAGNVYTCNLGVEGSVADMGIVGRIGLKNEDYDQLAVIRPHVSNLFALGGAVVAGPAGGAAMLLFSQIFRKPLSQLGQSYYRVTGGWDDPVVEQLHGSEINVTPLKNCEAYLENVLQESSQQ